VVQKGACLDCGLDFFLCDAWYHFDSMLSSFCCSMTCLKWLRLLNEPLKNHALFLLYESIYLVFSLMHYLGWLGACLQHVWLLQSRHKPLWSFGFWLVMPFYASLNNILSLCMIMAVIALLVGRSQSFASPHFILSMSSTHASNSQKPSYSNVSTIHTY
jgi:hypothetical protein